MHPLNIVATAALGISLAGSALGAVAIRPATAVAYRQGLYRAILWNFVPMSEMVRGRLAWNHQGFAQRAGNVAFYSTQLLEGFTPGSITARSEAKPEIWRNWADFSAKMKNFEDASAKLAEISTNGNESATKQAFRQVAMTCKACHDHYRRN